MPGFDTYYYYGDRLPTLVSDIVGPVPTECSKAPGLGIEGFKTRVNNVAMSLTNA